MTASNMPNPTVDPTVNPAANPAESTATNLTEQTIERPDLRPPPPRGIDAPPPSFTSLDSESLPGSPCGTYRRHRALKFRRPPTRRRALREAVRTVTTQSRKLPLLNPHEGRESPPQK